MSLSATSTRLLNTCRDRDSITSLGSLLQSLTTLFMKKFFLRSKLDFPWHNLRPRYISSFHLGYRKPVFRLQLCLTPVTGAGTGSHRGVPRTALLLMLWPKEHLNCKKDLCGKGCEKSLVVLVFGIKPGCYSSFPKAWHYSWFSQKIQFFHSVFPLIHHTTEIYI